jgi:hypothetical protein
MIGEIISSYLRERGRRVIIPGVGAFIKRDNGEVVFLDILNSNDGVLIGEVQNRLQGELKEAAAAVEQYSLKLKNSLLIDRVATIEGLGTLRVTGSGDYELIPLSATAPPSSETDPGGTGTETEELPRILNASQIEVLPKTDDVPHVHGRSENDTIHGSTVQNGDDVVEDRPLLPVVEKQTIAPPSPVEDKVVRPATGDHQTEQPVSLHRPGIDTGQRKKRKGPDRVMLIAIIAILIALGVLIYGYFVQQGYNIDPGDIH